MATEEFKNHVKLMSPLIRDVAGMVKSFEKEIASNRRSSLIQSFEELVMLLVRRLVIDPEDVSTWTNLNNVCMKFGGKPFYIPNFSEQILHQGVSAAPNSNTGNDTRNSHLLHPDGPIVVYLSKRIQFSWRNFARGLKVPQGDIDKIEKTHGSDYKSCIKAVLEEYKENLSWASPSNGNIIKDIRNSLRLLQKDYLIEEFERLTEQ